MQLDLVFSVDDTYESIPGGFWTILPRVANPAFRPGVRDGKKGAEGSLSAISIFLSNIRSKTGLLREWHTLSSLFHCGFLFEPVDAI